MWSILLSFAVILLTPVYFIPTIVASNNAHSKVWIIGTINLFLGWTVIGWICALVWANSEKNVRKENRGTLQDLKKLADYRDKGLITEEEFQAKKKQILDL